MIENSILDIAQGGQGNASGYIIMVDPIDLNNPSQTENVGGGQYRYYWPVNLTVVAPDGQQAKNTYVAIVHFSNVSWETFGTAITGFMGSTIPWDTGIGLKISALSVRSTDPPQYPTAFHISADATLPDPPPVTTVDTAPSPYTPAEEPVPAVIVTAETEPLPVVTEQEAALAATAPVQTSTDQREGQFTPKGVGTPVNEAASTPPSEIPTWVWVAGGGLLLLVLLRRS